MAALARGLIAQGPHLGIIDETIVKGRLEGRHRCRDAKDTGIVWVTAVAGHQCLLFWMKDGLEVWFGFAAQVRKAINAELSQQRRAVGDLELQIEDSLLVAPFGNKGGFYHVQRVGEG